MTAVDKCARCSVDRHATCTGCECGTAHFVCQACIETLPEEAKSSCPHDDVCDACVDAYCRDCATEDHFYAEVDRQYAMHKDGEF